MYELYQREIKLMRGDFVSDLDKLMDGKQADLVYIDPPWDKGKITYFYNLANENNKPDLGIFFEAIVDKIAKYCGRYFIIEICCRNLPIFTDILRNRGLNIYGIYDSIYYGKYKYHHIFGGKLEKATYSGAFIEDEGITLSSMSAIYKEHQGEELTKMLVHCLTKPNDSLLDFCCGLGMSIRSGINADLNCYGMELVVNRLTKLTKWLDENSINYQLIGEKNV